MASGADYERNENYVHVGGPSSVLEVSRAIYIGRLVERRVLQ